MRNNGIPEFRATQNIWEEKFSYYKKGKSSRLYSLPVLRRDGDNLYVAFFIINVDRKSKSNLYEAPAAWFLLDIFTGDVRIMTAPHSAVLESEYFEMRPFADRPEASLSLAIFDMLDALRKEYVETKFINQMLYREYFDKVLSLDDSHCHAYYQELSNV